MDNMKKWFFVILGYVILVVALFVVSLSNDSVSERWKTAEANVKAYDELLSAEHGKSVAYSFTIDQLGGVRDSLLRELDELREELGVKDKNLKSLQRISSVFTRTDTVVFCDTVVADGVYVDTVIGDSWYSARINLSYPSSVSVAPLFKSEKSVVVSLKKETVDPPKKWWLLRLFQKKHKVVHVDVIERNPYVSDSESRYVEIIK